MREAHGPTHKFFLGFLQRMIVCETSAALRNLRQPRHGEPG
ncbi:hypothetical protein HMPREF9946_04230 [Acetobacteraceae bacterium AT-5844]|nr:hypothetical protein HMPREF9946_04230 [Acetobacteraceae bacterium AT-5844]